MVLGERHKAILALLKQKGSVTVNELTVALNASPATIRRDLELLEQTSLLRRTYGGAIEYTVGYEPSLTDRATKCTAEKIAIARLAASLIAAGDIIALDSGTTTYQIAKQLISIEPLSIITTSLTIAEIFANADNDEHTIIIPGGIVRTKTHSVVGEMAESNLMNYRCNTAFMSCQSITPENGAMNDNLLAMGIKRALINISQKIVIVADHSKFEKMSLATVVPTKKIDVLITDEKTSDTTLQSYRDLGIEVIIAHL
ncbi:MAG: DeoR/GlpR family DNA-binding transcription regulator [Veillonellales bacterium]